MTREQLNTHLRDTGLFFPIDPGANASIGGMTSTRASGTNAVRYGTMKENVLAVTVVTAQGEEIRTARRARKSSAGYDLTRLFVGAEGTLGVLTSVTLRLQGIPQKIAGGVCAFPSVKAACDAVIMTIQMGIPVARIELLDAVQMRACRNYSGLSYEEKPTLFLEFHGTDETVALQIGAVLRRSLPNAAAASSTGQAMSEERNKLWKARHDAYWSVRALAPDLGILSTDVCVPISRLADCVAETQADIEKHGLLAPIVGHAGDGNFHVLLLFDDKQCRRYRGCRGLRRAAERAGARDGRHLHGRTRHRPGQDGVSGAGTRRRGRSHAPDQTWPRSRQYLQSRQDLSHD